MGRRLLQGAVRLRQGRLKILRCCQCLSWQGGVLAGLDHEAPEQVGEADVVPAYHDDVLPDIRVLGQLVCLGRFSVLARRVQVGRGCPIAGGIYRCPDLTGRCQQVKR
jgi:hypothetical protein